MDKLSTSQALCQEAKKKRAVYEAALSIAGATSLGTDKLMSTTARLPLLRDDSLILC